MFVLEGVWGIGLSLSFRIKLWREVLTAGLGLHRNSLFDAPRLPPTLPRSDVLRSALRRSRRRRRGRRAQADENSASGGARRKSSVALGHSSPDRRRRHRHRRGEEGRALEVSAGNRSSGALGGLVLGRWAWAGSTLFRSPEPLAFPDRSKRHSSSACALPGSGGTVSIAHSSSTNLQPRAHYSTRLERKVTVRVENVEEQKEQRLPAEYWADRFSCA